ncbi:MAG: hypothetical protein K9M75_06875 [Phycisphaerae bacterium]|nr:hypothetical protein [Phycisphaerae bacterium]
MIPLLATIIDGLIIGGCVFVVCFGLIYILFFRGKIQTNAGASDKALPASAAISDADYELITERLMQIEGKYTTVLFAASSIKCLPITIPVNVGVSLAQSGKRCLLIDMDFKRNAIAKAFEVDEQAAEHLDSPRGHKTSFDNLRLWPAHNFAHKNAPILADVIEGAKNEFDFVIISAPNLAESPDQTQIASASDCAFIFAQNADDATKLSSLMKPANCSIIGNVKIAAT